MTSHANLIAHDIGTSGDSAWAWALSTLGTVWSERSDHPARSNHPTTIHFGLSPHESSNVRVGPKPRRDIQPSMEQPWSTTCLQWTIIKAISAAENQRP